MVVAVGDDQLALGVELERVRCPEFARRRPGSADDSEELPAPVEYRDAPDEVGICHIRMALCDVNVTIPRVRHDVSRVSQGVGRISPYAWFSQRQQDLAFRAEFDDSAS